MARAKSTADVLTEVRARVTAPNTNGLLSDDETIELADQEMRTELADLLISARSEYWLTSYTVSITSGLADYRIPDRSLLMGLRDVTIYDSTGREWNVPQVGADRRALFATGNAGSCDPARAFTLENGAVTLLPTPAASGYTLRLRYYRTPSTLTAVGTASTGSNCTLLRAPSATTLYATDVISNTALTTGDTLLDAVRGAGMYDLIFSENVLLSFASHTFTLTTSFDTAEFASHLNTTADSGKRIDYICVAGTTPLPPIPEALWPVLISATCRSYCEAVNDRGGMEAAQAVFERRKHAAAKLLQPRVDGEPVQAIPLDTPLRAGRARGWR